MAVAACLLLLAYLPLAPRATRTGPAASDGGQPAGGQGGAPMLFEPQGEGFRTQALGYRATIMGSRAVLDVRSSRKGGPGATLGVRLEGSARNGTLSGTGPQATANYLIGRDPARWRLGVPSYLGVILRQAYPGIDVSYHGSRQALEMDFTLAPGADPSRIAIAYEGATGISLSRKGDLAVETAAGRLVLPRPYAYQESASGKDPVQVSYRLEGNRRVRFSLGDFDNSRTLVIDPRISYSTYLGGHDWSPATSVATDPAGNTYVAGRSSSPDWYGTPGAFQTRCPSDSSGGCMDTAYVAKFDGAGHTIYVTFLGGKDGVSDGFGVAADAAGQAYVTGVTGSSSFPTTPGAFQPAQTPGCAAANGCAFVAKLDPTGTRLVYSTYLGPAETLPNGVQKPTIAFGIAVDPEGNAFVTGETGYLFPTTPGAARSSAFSGPANESDTGLFLARLNASGDGLGYSTLLPEDAQGDAQGVALDPAGNAYVVGDTGEEGVSGQHKEAVFVHKVSPDGRQLLYSTYLAGNDIQDFPNVTPSRGFGIAVDQAGEASITGWTQSRTFPTKGQPILQSQNFSRYRQAANGFVSKLTADGSDLVWSTYLGGSARASNSDEGHGIAVDRSGNVYVTGQTASDDFPVAGDPCPLQATNHGSANAFVSKISPDGTSLIWSTYLGGSSYDEGNAIAYNETRQEALVAGKASSPDFPTTAGSYEPTSLGGTEGFMTRLRSSQPSDCPGVPVVATITPNAGPVAGGTRVTIAGTSLSGAQAVYFGSTAVTQFPCPAPGSGSGSSPCFNIDSPIQITAYSPAAASGGSVHVRVKTGNGLSGQTPLDLFQYVGPPASIPASPSPPPTPGPQPSQPVVIRPSGPSISGIEPPSGPLVGGTRVAVLGSGFAGARAVFFGRDQLWPCSGSAAPSDARPCFSVMDAHRIQAVSPPAPANETVHVRVIDASGVSSPRTPADLFEYTNLVARVRFLPDSASIAAAPSNPSTPSGGSFTGGFFKAPPLAAGQHLASPGSATAQAPAGQPVPSAQASFNQAPALASRDRETRPAAGIDYAMVAHRSADRSLAMLEACLAIATLGVLGSCFAIKANRGAALKPAPAWRTA